MIFSFFFNFKGFSAGLDISGKDHFYDVLLFGRCRNSLSGYYGESGSGSVWYKRCCVGLNSGLYKKHKELYYYKKKNGISFS